MIYRACGIFKTSYAADMELYSAPLAKYAVAAVAIFCAVIVPLLSDNHLLSLANFVGIAVVGAIGLNILTGYTGQISIGHGAFMAIGGYVTAILSHDHHTNLIATLPLSFAITFACGVLVGIPASR